VQKHKTPSRSKHISLANRNTSNAICIVRIKSNSLSTFVKRSNDWKHYRRPFIHKISTNTEFNTMCQHAPNTEPNPCVYSGHLCKKFPISCLTIDIMPYALPDETRTKKEWVSIYDSYPNFARAMALWHLIMSALTSTPDTSGCGDENILHGGWE
jgi:hypothetical protein